LALYLVMTFVQWRSARALYAKPTIGRMLRTNNTGIMTAMYLRMALVSAMMAVFAGVAFAQGGESFRNEIRVPLSLTNALDESSEYSAGLEFNRYFSARVHDEHRVTLFSEPVGNPTSSLQLEVNREPNPDITVRNTGYGGRASFVYYTGSIGVGASGRYNRITLDNGDRLDDYEMGPLLAFWPGERLYITDGVLYRTIGAYRNTDLGFNASAEDFVQIRHHLVYAIAENWNFTYTHDVELLAGIHQNIHTNSLIMNNYFMFSPSQRISYGPAAGFKLEYRLGSRTSVLTIPVRARVEYFLSDLLALYGEAGYNIPTMLGQREGRMSVLASAAYRF
jgi:hypothetical protein